MIRFFYLAFKILCACGVFQILISQSSKAKAVLNFAQVGITMKPQFNGDQQWASIGANSQEFSQPGMIKKANEARLAFPLTGSDFSDSISGWKSSPWLGSYATKNAPWIYHRSLGWVYLVQTGKDSIWIWQEELGWSWTSHTAFPYLYQNSHDAWLALKPESADPALVFDFPNSVWFEVGRRMLTIDLTLNNEKGGSIEGKRTLRKGDDLFLIARPQEGFLFAGWSGDLKTGENPLLHPNISTNLTLTARFLPIQGSLTQTDLNFLSSEKLRAQALLEIAIDGTSNLLSSGNSNPISEPFSATGKSYDKFRVAMGEIPQDEITGIFRPDSAVISHPFAPWKLGEKSAVYFEGSTRGQIELEVEASEKVHNVECLRLSLTSPDGVKEIRWLAEDSNQNIWLIHSSKNGKPQIAPFILIPAQPKSGWKSWTSASAIPSNFAFTTEFPAQVHVSHIGQLDHCLSLMVKPNHSGQIESYAEGIGLVKIFTP